MRKIKIAFFIALSFQLFAQKKNYEFAESLKKKATVADIPSDKGAVLVSFQGKAEGSFADVSSATALILEDSEGRYHLIRQLNAKPVSILQAGSYNIVGMYFIKLGSYLYTPGQSFLDTELASKVGLNPAEYVYALEGGAVDVFEGKITHIGQINFSVSTERTFNGNYNELENGEIVKSYDVTASFDSFESVDYFAKDLFSSCNPKIDFESVEIVKSLPFVGGRKGF